MRYPDVRVLRYISEYRLPFPAAVFARLSLTSENPVDEVGALVASIECLTAFLIGLTASILGTLERDPNHPALQVGTMARQTMGQSVSRLRRLVNLGVTWSETKDLNQFVPEWFKRLADVERPLADIVELRNRLVHDGPVITERAAACLPDLRKAYWSVIEICDFFSRLECIVTSESKLVARSTQVDLGLRIATGCNPLFETRRVRTEAPLDPSTVYLIDSDSSIAYSLYPYVVCDIDSSKTSLRNTTFALLDSTKNNVGTWLRVDYGYAWSVDSNTDDVGASSTRIRDSLAAPLGSPAKVPDIAKSLASISMLHGRQGVPVDFVPGFEIVGPLRSGDGTVVMQAVHKSTGQSCTLKTIQPDALTHVPALARLEREIDILTRFRRSPYIVEMVDSGQTRLNVPFVATKYASFGTVDEWVSQRGAVAWRDVQSTMVNIAHGLVELHAKEILHRDITPANLLITSTSPLRAVLADFGAAIKRSGTRVTVTGDQVGTPHYMAPEMLQDGREPTPRSDIYSLGVVAIEMLSGTPVVASDDITDVLDVPDEAAELLRSMTSSLPENRPPTADALLSRLLRLRSGGTSPLRPVAQEKSYTLGTWTSQFEDQYRRIPQGRFLMGGTLFPNETPIHEVKIPRPLLVAATPVTNVLFSSFLRATRYRSESERFQFHQSKGRRDSLPESWRHPQAPAVFLSWRDANAYCLWRSESEGLDYRLLSEAEWEYACRAGTTTRYYWGNRFEPNRVNCGQRLDGPTPVGSFDPNPWGLFDMLGNVWEWTRDRLDVVTRERSLFYSQHHPTDSGHEAPVNDGPNVVVSQRVPPDQRVGRGGSWFSNDRNMRPANRRGEFESAALRAFGFRLCVRGVPDTDVIPDSA